MKLYSKDIEVYSDKDFCIEYVKRTINLGMPRTKIAIEMKKIVVKKEKIEVEKMFGEESLLKLYQSEPVVRFVYSYIRDNQEEFINEIKNDY